MANQFYVEPADLSLGFDKALAGVQQGIETRKVAEQTLEDKQAMSAFAENFENMTPVEVGQYVLNNPRVAKFIVGTVETTAKMTKQERLDDAIEVATAFITGDQGVQEQSGQPPAQPVQPPEAIQPTIGLEPSPVAPVIAPIAPAGQTPIVQPETGQVPAGKDKAVRVLTDHVQENLKRGGNSGAGIELVRDAMTGGEKAFKGAMASIAALDPQTFDRLMKLQGGETTPATDIDDYVSRANEESIRLTGEPLTPGGKNKAALEFKRMQAGEASTVTTAKKTAELDVIKEMQPGIERDKAIATYQAKAEETRAGDLINRGLLAAESSATIRRGIELLETVETGGVDAAALAIKRTFGVEGADEGELSQALGKAVLSQLRETFGAQFTQEEGNRLIRLEAGFGKSVVNNKRLLKQSLKIVERTAKRARRAAEKRGDKATVEDIDELMSFSLSTQEPTQQPAAQQYTEGQTATGPNGQRVIFRNGNWEAM